MTSDLQTARDDLAFLRSLVGENDDDGQMKLLGEGYLIAGLIYGGQMIGHALQGLGVIPNYPMLGLAIGLGPTIVFVPLLFWWMRRRHRNTVRRGAMNKAIAGLFQILGMTNLVFIVVIAAVAIQQKSFVIWLIYGCSVFVLQGAAWLFAFMMRRQRWHLAVAMGWFVCAIGMALTVNRIPGYILFAGLGLWLCMALPGYVMSRGSQAAV